MRAQQANLQTPEADPFVGRENDLGALRASWERATAGKGGLTAILGPIGVGKTRLAEELRRVVSRAEILFGTANGAMVRANGPWIDALRAHAAVSAGNAPKTGLIGEIAQAERFADTLVPWLLNLASKTPVLIVLDDADQADPATLTTLAEIACAAKGARFLVVTTGACMPDEVLHDAEPLRLRPLDPKAVAELAARLLQRPLAEAVVSRLAEQTEGNPLFLRELLRLLAAEGGLEDQSRAIEQIERWSRVEEAIAYRLRRLPGRSLELLKIAAGEGSDFDARALCALAGQETEQFLDELDAVERAGTFGPSPWVPGRYRFTHPLIREIARRASLESLMSPASQSAPAPTRPDDRKEAE